MANKGRNGLLGVGGQRRKISRQELRGGTGRGGGGNDPLAQKRELLRKMQERAAEQAGAEQGATADEQQED